MAGLPKISIVTPSFNHAHFLETTIKSVLDQDYPNLEYIIIDGGSTDGSVDVIKKYSHRLAAWVSEKDRGMYDAIQKGFLKSTGAIMGWINSDDVLHPGSLATIAQIFSDFPSVHWLQGYQNIIDEKGLIVVAKSAQLDRFMFYSGKYESTSEYIQQESTFWSRDLWTRAGNGLRTDFRLAGDFELWLRFFKHENLYTTTAFLGSFRRSKKGQASHEYSQEYLAETRRALELNPLTKGEASKLTLWRMLYYLEQKQRNATYLFKRFLGLHSHRKVNESLYFSSSEQRFKMLK